MADTKLTDLSPVATVASGDKLYIVDVSDTTDSSAGTSKYITKDTLVTDLTADDITGLTSSVAELNYLDGVTGADVARRYYTKIVSTDSSGDYECDGTADDVQIQAAITAVETAGGGAVFIRSGTYSISNTLELAANNTTIIGESKFSTILKMANSVADLYIIDFNNYDDIVIDSITFDGNAANNTANQLLLYLVGASRITIKNCTFINQSGTTGICLYGDGGDVLIDRCMFKDAEGDAIGGGSMSDSVVSNCNFDSIDGVGIDSVGFNSKIINNTFTSVVGNAVQLDYGRHHVINNNFSTCTTYGVNSVENDAFIIGNYFLSNAKPAIRVQGDYAVVSGNVIINPYEDAIEIDTADYCTITGNIIQVSTDLDADDTYSGIILENTAISNVISGNTIMGDSTNDFQYGIRESAAADNYNIITNNRVTGCDTANISSNGANSDVSHNITS